MKRPGLLPEAASSMFSDNQNFITDGVLREVILATNFTPEGEATARYIGDLLQTRGIKVRHIARGLPATGELEHVDSGTLAQAVLEWRDV